MCLASVLLYLNFSLQIVHCLTLLCDFLHVQLWICLIVPMTIPLILRIGISCRISTVHVHFDLVEWTSNSESLESESSESREQCQSVINYTLLWGLLCLLSWDEPKPWQLQSKSSTTDSTVVIRIASNIIWFSPTIQMIR